MTGDQFTDPDDGRDDWVDVRMTDPEQGEWDVDVIVSGGTVQYVDLRIKPELLASFVACLVDDVDGDRATETLATVAERAGVDLAIDDAEE